MADGMDSYVDVPTDLQVALAEHAGAMSTWRALTREERKAHVATLDASAGPMARERCLLGLIRDLEVYVPGQSSR